MPYGKKHAGLLSNTGTAKNKQSIKKTLKSYWNNHGRAQEKSNKNLPICPFLAADAFLTLFIFCAAKKYDEKRAEFLY